MQIIFLLLYAISHEMAKFQQTLVKPMDKIRLKTQDPVKRVLRQ